MKDGYIQVYYGNGKGKTTASIGQGIYAINDDKKVIMIQFLSGADDLETEYLKKLEPEFRTFSFAKKKNNEQQFCYVDELKTESITAFNFSKKILDTGECDILILDEILMAIDKNYLEEDNVCELLSHKSPSTIVILTGETITKKIAEMADFIYCIEAKKEVSKET